MYKTYVIDIDGTICTKTDGDYRDARPFEDRIAVLNELHDRGHQIIYLTARGMGRFNNDEYLANRMFYKLTKDQLEQWGVKYTSLFLGKPAGDIYVDDKGCSDVDFFSTRRFEQ